MLDEKIGDVVINTLQWILLDTFIYMRILYKMKTSLQSIDHTKYVTDLHTTLTTDSIENHQC